VWSLEACLNGNSASLTDDDLYVAGRELGQEAHYAEALNLFFRIKNREQARVLSSISYSTRKLGDVDNSIDYYHQALAIDPNYTKARQSRRNLSAEGRRGEGERAADGDRRPLRRSLR
jgi:tetratricopeptide (TPR) repeat protein